MGRGKLERGVGGLEGEGRDWEVGDERELR